MGRELVSERLLRVHRSDNLSEGEEGGGRLGSVDPKSRNTVVGD